MRVDVPIDIRKIESNIFFGLTLRQVIYFSLAGIVGFFTYLISEKLFNSSDVATIALVISTAPILYMLILSKDGISSEQLLKDKILYSLHPKVRKKRGLKNVKKIKK